MNLWLRIFLPFAAGYYFSYFLRNVNAVIAPELVMSQGQLIATWADARLFGAAAATAWFWWRRDMLGTIVVGTTVMMILRMGLGW